MSTARPRPAPLQAGQLRLLQRGFEQGRATTLPATGGQGPDGAPEARAVEPLVEPQPETQPQSETAAQTPAAGQVKQGREKAPRSAKGPRRPATTTPAPDPEQGGGQEEAPAAQPQPPSRALAVPPDPEEEMARRTVNLAPDLIATADAWLLARRATHRRPALSWLVDAALRDLPTDLPALKELAAQLPEELLTRPHPLGVSLRRATIQRLEDAQFELSRTHRRGAPLWHAVSAAIANQLAAEGFPVPGAEGEGSPEIVTGAR